MSGSLRLNMAEKSQRHQLRTVEAGFDVKAASTSVDGDLRVNTGHCSDCIKKVDAYLDLLDEDPDLDQVDRSLNNMLLNELLCCKCKRGDQVQEEIMAKDVHIDLDLDDKVKLASRISTSAIRDRLRDPLSSCECNGGAGIRHFESRPNQVQDNPNVQCFHEYQHYPESSSPSLSSGIQEERSATVHQSPQSAEFSRTRNADAQNGIDAVSLKNLCCYSHKMRNESKISLASFSGSSSEDEDIVCFEADILKDYIFSEGSASSVGNAENLYNDWDSGLSSNSNNSNDYDEEAVETWSNFLNEFEEAGSGENQLVSPIYPHRALRHMECEICITKTYLRRRVCCDYRICPKCISTYISMKVQEARVQIECPNDRCNVLIHRDEIKVRLSPELKVKFEKFLIDANADPCKKTCPACSEVHSINPSVLTEKKKLKRGLKIHCYQCKLQWCFLCQAPYHVDVTCKQFRKGDEMVRKWAKEISYGQTNAQRCPKCKIFIQKVHGCNHMRCTQCNTDFCYRCGDRYIGIKFLGSHRSRFSLFGCKYRLMPKKPVLRRVIRGTNFAGRLIAGLVLASLGLAVGAFLVGASVIILPGYGIFRLKRHMWAAKERKKFHNQKRKNTLAAAERRRVMDSLGPPLATIEESEAEMADTHQVQALVHRSISYSHQEEEEDDDVEWSIMPMRICYMNRFMADEVASVGSGDGTIENSLPDEGIKDFSSSASADYFVTKSGRVVARKSGQTRESNHRKGQTQHAGTSEDVDSTDGQRTQNVMDPVAACEQSPEENQCNQEALPEEKLVQSESEAPHNSPHEHVDVDSNELAPKDDLENNSYTEVTKKLATTESRFSVKDDSCKLGSDANKLTIKIENSEDTKHLRNGCFGNIFSKRSPISPSEMDELGYKIPTGSFQSKFLNRKSATWEKRRSSRTDPVLKLLPHKDAALASKQVSIMLQRSPSDVSSKYHLNQEISFESENLANVKPLKWPACRGGDTSVGREKERTDCQNSCVYPEMGGDVTTSLSQITSDAKYSDLHSGHGDEIQLPVPAETDCFVSPYSAVTYL